MKWAKKQSRLTQNQMLELHEVYKNEIVPHEHMVKIPKFQQLLKHIPQGGRREGGAISICGLVCPDS